MPKLHIDTDLGGDIDDLCALAMVLNWPGAELVGVTTVAEHQGKRAGYVRLVLKLARREDVPVAAGAEAFLGRYRLWQRLPDEAAYWPEPVPPAPTASDQALTLLERSIEQGARVAAIGAFTNLAFLEERSPGILGRAELYLMGGYVFPPREGFPAWRHDFDFNAQVDAEAARLVIERSTPTLITLAVTAETSLRRAHLSTLSRAGPVARLIAHQAEAFAREQGYETLYGQSCSRLPDDTINFLHDPLACAIALGWDEGVEVGEFRLKTEIKDGWLHHTIGPGGKPTRVVTRIDGDRFSEFWLTTVAGTDRAGIAAP
jgi:inosine-uridine nucleoside N-ribohydrolase